MKSTQPERIIGRYALFREIASGGMASVHLGRLLGPVGFSRVVAIKRLHPHLARDPEFVAMFIDEARLAARVQHPNVVPTLDVVALDGELFIVMEYIEGESLARLVRLAKTKGQRIPLDVINAVMIGTLHGLHAAHGARGEGGRALGLVHRDVSPQNILIGADGLVRVVDFGIAIAAGRSHRTASGVLKGKLRYMAPEQVMLEAVDRRTDVYAASVVLWELLAGRGLFAGESEWQVAEQIRNGNTPPPSSFNSEVSPALDQIVQKGCATKREDRFPTAGDMAEALIAAAPCAIGRTVGKFVESLARESLSERRRWVEKAEASTSDVQSLEALSHEDAERTGEPETLARELAAEDDELPTTVEAEGDDGKGDEEEPSKTRAGGAFAGTRPVQPAEAASVAPAQAVADQPAQAPAERVRRRLPPAAGGVVAGVFLAAVLGLVALASRSSTPTQDEAVSNSVSHSNAPPTPVVASSGLPSRSSAAPPEAAPSAEHGTSASGTARQTKLRPAATLPAAAPQKPPLDCNPPYYVDGNGDKHFRRECLKQ